LLLWGKSKIEDQRLVDTLTMYHQAKSLPMLSKDEKEEAFFLFLAITDLLADRSEVGT